MHLIFWYTVSSSGGSSSQLSASFGRSQTNCAAMSKAELLSVICRALSHAAQPHARVWPGVWAGPFEPSLPSHSHSLLQLAALGELPGLLLCCLSRTRPQSLPPSPGAALLCAEGLGAAKAALLRPPPIATVTASLRGTCEGPEPGHAIWRANHYRGTPLAP